MAVIRVIRNKRQRQDYMSALINRVWNKPGAICKWAGWMHHAGAIVSAFEMVQRAYVNMAIPVHCFQLIFNPDTQIKKVQELVNAVVLFLNSQYQTIAVLHYDANGCLIATFVLNSVSYIDGSLFYDNNSTYQQIKKILEKLGNYEWTFVVGESVYFNNEDDVKRYPDMADRI